MKHVRSQLVLAICTGCVSAVADANTESSMYPWQLLSGGYNSSVNDGRILGFPAAPPGAGFFDLAENAIMTMTADATPQSPWPASVREFATSNPGAVGCGGAREVDTQCAAAVTYRVTPEQLEVSSDGGRAWHPLTAACARTMRLGADFLAVDALNAGHVVTARAGDASGCPKMPTNGGQCNERGVAWNGDIGPQLIAALGAEADGAEGAPPALAHRAVDLAGGADAHNDAPGWRYAGLSHLALSTDAGVCDVEHATLGPNCSTDVGHFCHGTKPVHWLPDLPPVERACPEYNVADCQCIGADGRPINPTHCASPTPTALAIDPRNGAVYAPSASGATLTGLLFSPDGGRTWRRSGHGAFCKWSPTGADITAAAEPWPYADPPARLDEATDPGVRLLTLQGLPPLPLAVFGAGVALDLNAQPEVLVRLSPVAFAMTPCGASHGTYSNPALPGDVARPRVRVTAMLTATWRNPTRTDEERTGVFVAHGDSCTDEAARLPLVFWDGAAT